MVTSFFTAIWIRVKDRNDGTVVQWLAIMSRTITFTGPLENEMIQIFSSTSDTGRSVKYGSLQGQQRRIFHT
jgi:hypothetical protein